MNPSPIILQGRDAILIKVRYKAPTERGITLIAGKRTRRRSPSTWPFGDWKPRRWIRRMKHSNMSGSEAEDWRCLRCGRWPDQNTGVSGDWLMSPFRLCIGCLERVEYDRGNIDIEEWMAMSGWPKRGRNLNVPGKPADKT